jgi:hypothetical protein
MINVAQIDNLDKQIRTINPECTELVIRSKSRFNYIFIIKV